MTPPSARSSARLGLAVRSGVYALALVALYVVAVRTAWGQTQDAWSLGFQGALTPPRDLMVYLRQDSVVLGALAAGLAGLAALRDRRLRDVAAAVLLVLVALGAARALRVTLLGRPFLGETDYPFNTFPSGHATATTALLAAVLLLARPRWRRPGIAVLLTLVATAAALASVLTLAHRASDTLGGVLLVGALLPLARLVAGRPDPSPALPVSGVAAVAAAAGLTAYVGGVGHSAALSTLGLAVALAAGCLDVLWSATGRPAGPPAGRPRAGQRGGQRGGPRRGRAQRAAARSQA